MLVIISISGLSAAALPTKEEAASVVNELFKVCIYISIHHGMMVGLPCMITTDQVNNKKKLNIILCTILQLFTMHPQVK